MDWAGGRGKWLRAVAYHVMSMFVFMEVLDSDAI